MAKSKANLYSEKEQITASYMKALAYPARLRILEMLVNNGTSSVNERKKFHRLSYPTLSQHLKILEIAGLIESYEKFPYTYYTAIMANVAKAQQCLAEFFQINLVRMTKTDSANPQ